MLLSQVQEKWLLVGFFLSSVSCHTRVVGLHLPVYRELSSIALIQFDVE